MKDVGDSQPDSVGDGLSKAWSPRILWESDHEWVVYKPPGIAVELTSDPHGRSLLSYVRRSHPEARLPHRLDRVSRGILVVALHRDSVRFHNAHLLENYWQKLYLARIPTPSPESPIVGEHRAYLKRKRHRRGLDRMEIVRSGGKPSFLKIHAMADAPGHAGESHVLIELKTGRFHQIRAMLAGLGLPLVGDSLYGGNEGDVFLEHVRLRFRPCGAQEDRVIFDRSAAEREPVVPKLLDRIEQWS